MSDAICRHKFVFVSTFSSVSLIATLIFFLKEICVDVWIMSSSLELSEILGSSVSIVTILDGQGANFGKNSLLLWDELWKLQSPVTLVAGENFLGRKSLWHVNFTKLRELVKPKLKRNSLAWVRERTVPNERPPLVGKVSTNFCG
jgi:hypothetical protein